MMSKIVSDSALEKQFDFEKQYYCHFVIVKASDSGSVKKFEIGCQLRTGLQIEKTSAKHSAIDLGFAWEFVKSTETDLVTAIGSQTVFDFVSW